MKRPLAGVILSYAGGIVLGHFWQPPPVALWGGALAVAALAGWRGKFQVWLLWLLVLLSGWANIVTHTAVLSPRDLRALAGNNPAAVSLRGVVAEPTQLKVIKRADGEVRHSLTVLTVTELGGNDGWQSAQGRVMVMTPGTLDARFFPGQPVEVSGALALPAPPLAEGLLDYREYLRTRDIYYELKANATNDWHLAAGARDRPPLTQRFLGWAQPALARGLPAEDEPLRLIWAMTLGWRTAFTGDIGDPFLRAGTMHMFAIDGLRIALVSGMIITLLRVLQLSRALCGAVCVPVIWFYSAATGWEPSAIRASVMMTIIIAGWALKRPSDLLNSLAAAAFIILAWNPLQLFQAGFQLSFLVVLTIALMLPPLNDLIDQLLQFDPLVPEALISKGRRFRVWLLRHGLRYLALSLAAWVGSLPLSAKYFNLFSPISPLANVVAVPLGVLALMSNLGSLVCGAWYPFATVLFNHSAWFFMLAMTRVSELATRVPGAYWYVTAPSWTLIALYYLVVAAGLTAWVNVAQRKQAASIAMVSLLAAAAIGLWDCEAARRTVTVTVLPLSGGQAVFTEGGGSANEWLINCGSDSAMDTTLKPFLRARGVNRLHRLLLTTGDAASCGGAERLNELFPVNKLYTSGAHFRSATYGGFVDEFDQSPARHEILKLNDQIGGWQVLHPGSADSFPRGDDNALVLRGRFYHSAILLLSDLGRDGQSALLARTNDLRADVVVAGLPSQGEPLCDDLIRAAQPKIIVIVDAEYPVQRRAGPKLKARLARSGIPVIYTRAAGAVTIVERAGGWELRTMDGERFNSSVEKP